MDSRIATIARYTLIEALRTRLPALVGATLLALLAASFFIESISVTEGTRVQTGFYAASARLACVFIAVMIEHGGKGGLAAAPMAKEIFQAHFAKKKRPELITQLLKTETAGKQ